MLFIILYVKLLSAVLVCKVINALMKAVGCVHRTAADFATTVDREVCYSSRETFCFFLYASK